MHSSPTEQDKIALSHTFIIPVHQDLASGQFLLHFSAWMPLTNLHHFLIYILTFEVRSNKLILNSYPNISCDFIRRRNVWGKKFHKQCEIEVERIPVTWYTFDLMHCHTLQEAIGVLYFNTDEWWCWFSSRTLFILPECIRSLLRVF